MILQVTYAYGKDFMNKILLYINFGSIFTQVRDKENINKCMSLDVVDFVAPAP